RRNDEGRTVDLALDGARALDAAGAETCSLCEYKIFAHNRPLHGMAYQIGGKLYMPIEIVAEGLGLSLTKSGVKAYVNGRPLTDALLHTDGSWYVPLPSFAAANGNRYVQDDDRKMIDMSPAPAAPAVAPAAASA